MSNILVVGPAWVGDMVMAQSLLKVLKRQQPRAKITVLAPPWSAPLVARMPEARVHLELPVGHGVLGLGVRRKLGRNLRRQNFERAIVLPNSFKSALLPWFAKIPIRTGFLGEQRWGLLNDIRRLDKRALPTMVQRFVALGFPPHAADPQQSPLNADFPRPKLAVNSGDARACAKEFQKYGVRLGGGEILILCPGAEYGPAKQWPAEHFAQVAKQQLQHGWQVWLLGSAKDREICACIQRHCGGGCADLSGRTSLGQAVDLMSLAQHVITNDSGLMHIAAAVGSHVIALYGASSDAFTPPLTHNCHRLNLHLDCSPCFARQCPLGHGNCLTQLSPDLVRAHLTSEKPTP